VEALTDRMQQGAEEYFRRIEEIGGVVAGIEKGFFQREIAVAASAYQRSIEKEERYVVGVNRYQKEGERVEIDLLKIDPAIEKAQHERLRNLRARRHDRAVSGALKGLQQAAREEGNLMPGILEAVRAYATLGEICDALREIYGEYREPPIF
jgi:methylmalonyl-CoA mutase N-terminal domain/subunit